MQMYEFLAVTDDSTNKEQGGGGVTPHWVTQVCEGDVESRCNRHVTICQMIPSHTFDFAAVSIPQIVNCAFLDWF